MSKEIQQPDIERPDLKNPFTWALVARVYADWARHVGPQLGIDIEKYVLGDVLVRIIGDDANTFTWTVGGTFFEPDIASKEKRNLLERMDWEIGTPETPQDIRGRLESTLQIVSSLDWRNRDEFEQAQVEWYKLKEWVDEQIKERPELKEAREYTLVQDRGLSEYWNEFLYR